MRYAGFIGPQIENFFVHRKHLMQVTVAHLFGNVV